MVYMCQKCGNYTRDMLTHICPVWGTEPSALVKGVQQPLEAEGYQHSERKPTVILSEEAPPETVRGATHGDYTEMSQIIQEIKGVIRSGSKWSRMPAGQKEALELIATKIGRIVTGDPGHLDHWRDGAGYFNKGSESCGS